jgi:hypothetical protein
VLTASAEETGDVAALERARNTRGDWRDLDSAELRALWDTYSENERRYEVELPTPGAFAAERARVPAGIALPS